MSSESDHCQRNAFTVEFLRRLDESGEPDGAHEADVAGPWVVRQMPYRGATGFALLREWESVEAGDAPYAVFSRRELALVAAAVLPATGRELLFRLDTEPDADGFPLVASLAAPANHRVPAASSMRNRETGPETPETPETPVTPVTPTSAPMPRAGSAGSGSSPAAAGHLRDFDEALAFALHLAAALARSPVALAWLLEAAGHVALEQAGRILDRRVR